MFSAEQQEGLSSRTTTASCSMPRPAQPSRGDPPADIDTVRLNNRLRGAIDAALGGLTLMPPIRPSATTPRRRCSNRASRAPCRRWKRPSPRKPTPRIKRALSEARAAIILFSDERQRSRQTRGRRVIRERGDQDALGLLAACRPIRPPAVAKQRRRRDRRDPEQSRALGHGAERLVRAFARLGAAARRDRARHHLRRDGRHQHGAWRDGDARRLRDLRGAGGRSAPTIRRCSTIRWPSPCRSLSWSPAASASSSNAPSSAFSTAGRWKPCSRPGAFR